MAARVDLLLPAPLRASGGHRTAVAAGEALAGEGYEVHLHFARPGRSLKRDEQVRREAQQWHAVDRCQVHIGWPASLPASSAVIGTGWRSAVAAATVPTSGARLHFVQDYEAWFFPHGDTHFSARAVHDLGLRSIVIGQWLRHQLWAEHGLSTWTIPFTADLDLFRPPSPGGQPVRRVVAMYQPEKPRRCPQLMAAALASLRRAHPDVAVITVGSPTGIEVAGVEHRGVVTRGELAALYAEGGVGLSISASNPSRVPFEMMAAGLPVVEVHAPNTVHDFPADGCLLAQPDPASLTAALTHVLADPQRHAQMSAAAAQIMVDCPEQRERDAFLAAFTAAVSGAPAPPLDPALAYPGPPVRATAEQRGAPVPPVAGAAWRRWARAARRTIAAR